MPKKITIICPIAHDLAYVDGKIVCGPGTKLSCDAAVTLAMTTAHPVIFLCATDAPDFDNVNMGRVMARYLQEIAPWVKFEFLEAHVFNTLGEVLASGEYVHIEKKWGAAAKDDYEVVYVVKDWHAKRVEMLAEKMFRLMPRLKGVRFRVESHPAPGRWQDKLREPFKTFVQLHEMDGLLPADLRC